ncbi:zinc finger and SCAN domain-containing protein 20-like [Heteronotia binoei]|uniref:zinc finger and SCAN domain-containing protein 20-like n=1 Tax=Heteronotia binoei TaxID=13085 RepID=UPI0029313353|nr:zinc finger and SCAN domain-containing protein 20-like [Heteronotia binoei]
MAARRRRGTFWQREEVLAMLAIAESSGHAAQLMSSTHLNTRQIYRGMARSLQRRGFDRTAEQCRSKFKRLRCEFMASLQAWGGIPRVSGRTPYHEEMMRLWELAGRPRWEDRHPEFHNRPRGAEEQPGPPVQEEEQEPEGDPEGASSPAGTQEEAVQPAAEAAASSPGGTPGEPASSPSPAAAAAAAAVAAAEEEAGPSRVAPVAEPEPVVPAETWLGDIRRIEELCRSTFSALTRRMDAFDRRLRRLERRVQGGGL